MKDYQEALDEIKNMLNDITQNENDSFKYHYYIKLGTIDTLQALVNEKLEQESRKDYLKVDSEWECIVSCFANDSMYYKVGAKVKVLSLEEYDRVFFVRVKSEWQEVIFVVEQFLLCFKPLKEGE